MVQSVINQANRISPVRPMMMGSARGFSTTIDTDDSDLEEAASTSSETQKGRFFKFLEKAEELDDKIKVNPTEAKKVTS